MRQLAMAPGRGNGKGGRGVSVCVEGDTCIEKLSNDS